MSSGRMLRLGFVMLGLVFPLSVFAALALAEAGAQDRVVTFQQAEFVMSDARSPPEDGASWQIVTLPDEWRRRPGAVGRGWYRINFELHAVPESVQSLLVYNRRSLAVAFFVNGESVGGARDVTSSSAGRAGRGLTTTVRLTVPPSLLRVGENVVHVRMEASSDSLAVHGLGRVYFGEARPLQRMSIHFGELNFQAKRNAVAMALAAGIITLFLWLARRSDRVMMWFCITCLAWGLTGILYMKLRWAAPAELTSMLYFYMSYSLVIPTVILSLRTVDIKSPWFEAALGLFFVFELTYPLWPGRPWSGAYLAWDVTNTVMLLGAVGIGFIAAPRPLARPVTLQLAALAAMAAVMSFEILRYLGWVDIESPEVRHYHVPVMLLAMGTACFERHVRAIRQTAQANEVLESRVVQKSREIEARHAQIEEVRRERALVGERQRILADMHDGVGTTLVGLLRQVQAGDANPASVRARVQEALQEMRTAIYALQPHGSDLAGVLGGLRERLDALVAGSGARLLWRVEELPPVKELMPVAVFSLQRIVIEAVRNALEHGRASKVHFAGWVREDGDIEIRVEDDGRGFDPAHAGDGRGLADMRARAQRLGARLELDSRPGNGTVMRLIVPRVATEVADGRSGETGLPQGAAVPVAVLA